MRFAFTFGDVLLAAIVVKAPAGSPIQEAASRVLAERILDLANEVAVEINHNHNEHEHELEIARWADDGGRP
jgi:hypothetical protein